MRKGGKGHDIEDEPDLMDLLTNERVNVRSNDDPISKI